MSKYDSLRDEVIDKAANGGMYETLGEADSFGFYAFVTNFYGKDYIVRTNNDGYVDVETFDRNGPVSTCKFADECAMIRGDYAEWCNDCAEQDAWEARNEY